MAHTPGPWEIRHKFNVVVGNRGIAACGGYTSNIDDDTVYNENIANARLIAAAPDLLEMLEKVERALNSNSFLEHPMTPEIKAVIAKAKGE